MFCPNCGKPILENDNFCRYCGNDLRNQNIVQECIVEEKKEFSSIIDEEVVLYDVKKHMMTLVLPIFLVPLFFFYFWNIFLNTHSFLSWVIVIAILILIFYPIARYKSDRVIITNKFVHIKAGIINPLEIDIPLEKISELEISQTSMGRFLDYGILNINYDNERIDYGYICSPEDLQCIIDDPQEFVNESLAEDS